MHFLEVKRHLPLDALEMGRREFCIAGLGAPVLAPLLRNRSAREELPPVRQITRGPDHHWFGYYDKLQFDPDGRLALGMRVAFEHRSPRADDQLEIGVVDLELGDSWTRLGESRAWGWQQGCMLQWVPGVQRRVLWNDREGERFVTRLLDLESREIRTLPHPVYTLSPDGCSALSVDFARIQALRPGYGYVGLPDPASEELEPDASGLWQVDLESGEYRLLFSIAQVAAVGPRTPDMEGAKHYFNHLLYSPDGTRFIFLHRWRPDGGRAGFRTRMFTAAADGSELYLLDPSGRTSHFIWRDPRHVAAWSKPAGSPAGFYLFRDQSSKVEPLGGGVMTRDGHISYLPGNEWILCDTYPDRERREQHPYLVHVASSRRVPLGHFRMPPEYRGEWRCDTHPRCSPDGSKVIVDSTHTGSGRQMFLIDIEEIVG